MPMQPETEAKFHAYRDKVAALNGAKPGSESFTVTPTVAQTMESHVRAKSDFLSLIPTPRVRSEKIGDIVALNLTGTIARRTKGLRTPGTPVGKTDRRYETKAVFFDTTIEYSDIDDWARHPDYQTKMRDAVTIGIGNDRQMIGFHGTHAADESDPVANPMLQDAGKGWIQDVIDEAPGQVMSGVKIGPNGDFLSIDEAVNDVKNTYIDPRFRKAPDLRCLIDADMITGKYNELLRTSSAVEQEAAIRLLETQGVGNVRGLQPNYFPDRMIMLSPLSNFLIYVFGGGYRRKIKDEPDIGEGRISDFVTILQDYAMEALEACTIIKDILLPDGNGGWINAQGEVV